MSEAVQLRDTESEIKYKKFRLYKYITLAALVCFILLGLVVFENDITLENVRYLIKNITLDVDFNNISDESEIYYDSDTTNRFSVYKGDLVLVNNGGIYLYSQNGDVTFSDSFNMANPIVASGSRFFLVYDLGGYSFKIYNSFSLLYEETLSYTIQSASINSNGDFCINTSEKTYLSAVFIYNSNFERVYKWLPSDKFITDACINNNGIVYISSIKVDSGDLNCEIIELDYKKNKVKSTYSYKDEMPLNIIPSLKSCLVLTDKSIFRISEGKLLNEYRSNSESMEKVALDGNYPAFAHNKLLVGVNFEVKFLDDELEEKNSLDFASQILDIKAYDDYVYILTRNILYVIIDADEVKTFETDSAYTSFQILNSNSLVLCGDDHAAVYNFS